MRTVKDAFQLLFTEEMILIIVTETNRSARKAAEAWNEQNPDKKWQRKDTDSEEIWVFIGLLILAGVQRSQKENLHELWSMNSGRSIFRATMSKNRMDSLLKFCRFDDAATRDTRMEVDKLAPISEFWAMFLARLQIRAPYGLKFLSPVQSESMKSKKSEWTGLDYGLSPVHTELCYRYATFQVVQ
ncbi:unnamed protein product [Didymodactylos carnosus]|uniref:PiggyBac transposable element-derived protein domain-containing protein n=1 Tax=Didymodactylos carnosus TaxID=1234261 RepID=A0A814JEN5_9BILA|nr:unnamed protein product [Didymodactylos carnosus]CAF3808743.1 unnamed protein product [Didymodactylos carnosus]